MTGEELRTYAREMLGLALRADDASELAKIVVCLKHWTAETEAVPLPYTEEPFSSPQLAERWLERY